MNTHKSPQISANEPNEKIEHDEMYIQIMQEEGNKTRRTIWMVAIVSFCILILSPLLLAASPILALIIGLGFLSAFIGSFIGRFISRKREQKILNEVRYRNDSNIVPLQDHKSK